MLGTRPQLESIHALGIELEEIEDPGDGGAIQATRSGYVRLVSAGVETRTLAAPAFVGQLMLLTCFTDLGDNVVTVSAAFNASGNTTITMDTAGDCILLMGVSGSAGALRWSQVFTDGPTLG